MRLVLVTVLALATLGAFAPAASAHRDPCHMRHECPSDHATYKWRGMWCVKPTSPERTRAYKKRVVYGGRVYLCRR